MNTKQRKKINIVDIVIAVALLAALLCAGVAIAKKLGQGGERVTVSYTVAVDSIDSAFVSKAKACEGEGIFSHTSSERIGTVSAISSDQAYKKSYLEGSDPRGYAIEGKSVLYITAKTEAVKTETGYTVGNTVIGIGRELEIRLPQLYCIGECVRIEIIEE